MEATMQHITASELREKMLSDERPVLINALSEDSYQSKRIPGSINITEDNIQCAEKVIPEKKQDIVVYCANEDCPASPELAEKLLDMGYKNVWDFDNGLAGWKQEGFDLVGQDV